MDVWGTKFMRTLLIFLLVILLTSCDAGLCGNELIDEIASPDGKYVASIFERDCGATTPYIRVVSLRLSDTKFAPEDDDNWVFTIHDRSDVKVSWVAVGQLKISYSATSDQPTQREKWRDVLVSYD